MPTTEQGLRREVARLRRQLADERAEHKRTKAERDAAIRHGMAGRSDVIATSVRLRDELRKTRPVRTSDGRPAGEMAVWSEEAAQ